MTLQEARTLRDEIRDAGLHCVVPLGFGPNGYFARIFGGFPVAPKDFHDRQTWVEYKEASDKRRARDMARWNGGRPRSPIEIMIDRACGLE